MATLSCYEREARKYKPRRVRILFVAEAPPNEIERYFYFKDVREYDWLWIALMKSLYRSKWGGTKTERPCKEKWLGKFQMSGYQLIDAVKTPISGRPAERKREIRRAADNLIREIRRIDPEQIVLIKATVYDVLFEKLRKEFGPRVIDARLPFPSYWQKEFHDKFRQLVRSGKLKT